jgi:hypothetical protein
MELWPSPALLKTSLNSANPDYGTLEPPIWNFGLLHFMNHHSGATILEPLLWSHHAEAIIMEPFWNHHFGASILEPPFWSPYYEAWDAQA